MRRKSPFWLIALLLLGLAALAPRILAQQHKAPAPKTTPKAAAPSPPAAQTEAQPESQEESPIKRLILKDGSWQGIIRYEIKGNRVRYLSSERFDWEDIPKELIDWPATEKFAKEGHSANSNAVREVDAEEAAERKKEEEQTPEVSAGIRLPLQGGVYLLDVYNKEAQLSELKQNGGEVKRNTGKNILRATINPLASAKQTIELKGQHASVQAHVPDPYIYVNIDQPDADPKAKPQDVKDQYRIVRMTTDPKKNIRVVGSIKVAMYGKVSQERRFVPATAQMFSGPWVKVTPDSPLEPGEYALVEILPDNQMNLYVWDFGVDPKAPANPGAWHSEPSKANAATPDTPVLRKK